MILKPGRAGVRGALLGLVSGNERHHNTENRPTYVEFDAELAPEDESAG